MWQAIKPEIKMFNAHIKAFQAHQWQMQRKAWDRNEAFAALAKRA